ncbi:MAG: RNA-binding protein [Acidobacteriota bacterium]
MSGRKLFVGGLPYSTSDHQLETLFSDHGTVESARIVTDRMNGRSRGFGFVEMSTSEEAQACISALNGSTYEGRTLTVNEAKPREPRPQGGRSFGRNRW